MGLGEGRLAPFVTAAALCVYPANAGASDRCVTVSDRPLSELRADLRIDDTGKLASAIDVLEGEIVCVRVPLAARGETAFSVVSEGSREDTLRIELQRMIKRSGVREKRIVLSLRAPLHDGLSYRAAVSLGRGRDVREVISDRIDPDSEDSLGWVLSDRVRHHFLLFDLQVEPPPTKPERPLPTFLGISFVSSFHLNQLDALNAEFARNGFGAVSNLQPYLGFAFDGGFGRFRATWDIEAGLPRAGDAAPQSATALFTALHAGFAVYRATGFALFPMVGVAGGYHAVTVAPNRIPFLPVELRNVDHEEDIDKSLGWFLLSLGSEYRLPITGGAANYGGLLFGARVGYAFQFSQTNWRRDSPTDPSLPDAPAVDTSGPYARLGVGWYVE